MYDSGPNRALCLEIRVAKIVQRLIMLIFGDFITWTMFLCCFYFFFGGRGGLGWEDVGGGRRGWEGLPILFSHFCLYSNRTPKL